MNRDGIQSVIHRISPAVTLTWSPFQDLFDACFRIHQSRFCDRNILLSFLFARRCFEEVDTCKKQKNCAFRALHCYPTGIAAFCYFEVSAQFCIIFGKRHALLQNSRQETYLCEISLTYSVFDYNLAIFSVF